MIHSWKEPMHAGPAGVTPPREAKGISAGYYWTGRGRDALEGQLWSAHGSRTLWLGLFLPSPAAAIRCTIVGLVCLIHPTSLRNGLKSR